jgi:hypothetical protein
VLIHNAYAFEYEAPMVTAYDEHVYVALQHNPIWGTSSYSLIRSTDGGVSWDIVRQITSVSGGPWGDFQADEQSVQLVFESFATTPVREIAQTSSTDEGETWNEAQFPSTIDEYVAWDPRLAIDDSHDIYVCWQDAKYGSITGFSGTVLLRKSSDNGTTWLPEVRVSALASASHSSLIEENGVLHVVWDDERFGALNGTIQYTFSVDQGKGWCPDVTVGDTLDVDVASSVCAFVDKVHVFWSSYTTYPDTPDVFYRNGRLPPTRVTEAQAYSGVTLIC